MNKEVKERFLTEAYHHLEILRRTPSLAIYEMMRRALARAEATFEAIGTNQDEINRLLQANGSCLISLTAVGHNSQRAFLRQALLNEGRRLVEMLRPEPTLDKLQLVKRLLTDLDAKAEEIGSTNQELVDLIRRAYISETRNNIREYTEAREICALCHLVAHLNEHSEELADLGLKQEDILGLLLEIKVAMINISCHEDCESNPHDLH